MSSFNKTKKILICILLNLMYIIKSQKLLKKINIKDTLNKTKYNLKFLYLKIKSTF